MAIQRINLGTAPSGTGGDTNRTAFKKIDDNFTDSANAASRLVGTAAGNVMEVGEFGLGLTTSRYYDTSYGKNPAIAPCSIMYYGNDTILQLKGSTPTHATQIVFPTKQQNTVPFYVSTGADGAYKIQYYFRTTENTSVDPNGFIKNASPIVSLYADKIELNDEAKQQKITFEKLGVGDYLVKGSLGFAQEGWYIETPKDANGNVLVAVIYEQLANNDISVKTYAKMFDPDTGDIIPNLNKPRDIPAARWIDLRLQALPQSDIKPFNNYETAILDA